MGNFFRGVWLRVQRFIRWASRQKFVKIAARELFAFAAAFVLTITFWHLTFFAFFLTFLGAYLVSFFTFEWVLTIGKRKNDFKTWISRGFVLYIIYAVGQSVVNNIMPKPHDISYYFAGFIAGIVGYLISTGIKRMK
jgi:mannose/fructose/N-acetylgalactosamine-specific phosphotransferase system component IIC